MFGKRRRERADLADAAFCTMCRRTVAVSARGRCPLGHRMTPPRPAVADRGANERQVATPTQPIAQVVESEPTHEPAPEPARNGEAGSAAPTATPALHAEWISEAGAEGSDADAEPDESLDSALDAIDELLGWDDDSNLDSALDFDSRR